MHILFHEIDVEIQITVASEPGGGAQGEWGVVAPPLFLTDGKISLSLRKKSFILLNTLDTLTYVGKSRLKVIT